MTPPSNRSIRDLWVRNLTVLVVVFAILGIAVNLQVLLYGARRGAYEWLRASHSTGLRAYHAQVVERMRQRADSLQQLPAVAEALATGEADAIATALDAAWSERLAGEFWIARTPDGRLLGSLASCDAAALQGLDAAPAARVVICGETAALVAASPRALGRGARLFLAHAYDDAFLASLGEISSSDVLLVGPAGPLGSSLRDGQGKRLQPALPAGLHGAAAGVYFDSVELETPGFRGYRYGTEPVAAGVDRLKAYVYAAPVPVPDGGANVVLVLLIPSLIMDQGAWFSALGALVSAAAIVLLLRLIASRIASRIALPLVDLAGGVRRLAAGESGVRVEVAGSQEVAELGAAFNTMVEQLEESRARALQAEKMAAVGQLAGGIAHEVNNPLGVILGFAQTLEKRIPAGDPLRAPIQSIAAEALRCRNLVKELLVFSRTAKTVLEPVKPNELMRATSVLLAARARTQGIQLVEAYDEALPLLQANRTQLQQVIVNLGSNALDAMPAGGKLTLRTCLRGNAVLLEVSDTGRGIPEAIRGRIFEPFFTTKDPGKGTGLGLSLVWEIVRRHGGTVDVESREGAGTTMRLVLPAAAAKVAA